MNVEDSLFIGGGVKLNIFSLEEMSNIIKLQSSWGIVNLRLVKLLL